MIGIIIIAFSIFISMLIFIIIICCGRLLALCFKMCSVNQYYDFVLQCTCFTMYRPFCFALCMSMKYCTLAYRYNLQF